MAEPLSIHVNGCPNSCARIQTADIGLKGSIVLDADGNQVEGFQVHLGGTLGPDAKLGRKPRGLKVTSAELPQFVERVTSHFHEQRDVAESFAQWAQRADEGDLS
jgi:sulfite reductase (ferredoxin)